MAIQKEFDEWNERKKGIHELNTDVLFHEQEMWWCAMGINVGVEIDGKNKLFERPVLVFRKFNRDMFLGIPLTSKQKTNKNFYFAVSVNGQDKTIVISQIRIMSSKRLIRRLWRISDEESGTLKEAVIEFIKSKPPLVAGVSPVPNGNNEQSIDEAAQKST